MKNLIKKILKEELSDDDLNWIREVDPINEFHKWVESQSTRHGFKDLTDRHWLHLTEDTKAFIQEFTNDTHDLLESVENLNSSAGLQHTRDSLVNIQDMLGDEDGQSDNYYVDHFQMYSNKLWRFLNVFKEYGEKYNLTLKELLDLCHSYFERRVDDDIKRSESLRDGTHINEYNDSEKRSTTEITMALLNEAADHFAQGLRLIESATQFAYESNNEDLIRDLEKLRMTIQSGGDKMWAEREDSMNIVNRINDIIKKYN